MKKITTALLLTIMAIAGFSAAPKNYYFSESGSDTYTSLQAQNVNTPWKTTTKLNSFFTSLLPGDSALFKRGETFYGAITVSRSGTSTATINIGAYGAGEKPEITSLINIEGWENKGNGIWESDVYASLKAPLQIVLQSGKLQAIGRYPDASAESGGYLYLEAHTTTTITDNELNSSTNWTGADIIVRSSRWTIDKGTITAHSGSKITYKPLPGTYPARNNYGYFMQNDARTLTTPGEWYFNPSTKRLKMYSGNQPPQNVQAATQATLVYSTNNNSYITISNLVFNGANDNNVDINYGTFFTLINCDIKNSGKDGINASSTRNFRVENCTIINSLNNGIEGSGGNLKNVFLNNYVYNTYFIAGMGASGNGQGTGIRNGDGGIIQYNKIINSGYLGIHLGGDYSQVINNLIDSFSFVKDDGSGIYTYGGKENPIRTGRKITGNIILNGIGAGEGTASVLSNSAEGIYMDDNTNGVEITGNLVANIANNGFYMHNANNIQLINNTVFNCYSQATFTHDDLGNPIRNFTVTGNIFFAKQARQITGFFKTINNDIASYGYFDNNYYVKPADVLFTPRENASIKAYYNIYKPSEVRQDFSLLQWQAKYGKDGNSSITWKPILSDTVILVAYNATRADSTVILKGIYEDVKGRKYDKGEITLPPYASAILMKTGELPVIVPPPPPPVNIDPVVAISHVADTIFGAPTAIFLEAIASDVDGKISKVEFYSGAKLINTQNSAPYSFTWSPVPAGDYVITAKAIDAKGAFSFSTVSFSVQPKKTNVIKILIPTQKIKVI